VTNFTIENVKFKQNVRQEKTSNSNQNSDNNLVKLMKNDRDNIEFKVLSVDFHVFGLQAFSITGTPSMTDCCSPDHTSIRHCFKSFLSRTAWHIFSCMWPTNLVIHRVQIQTVCGPIKCRARKPTSAVSWCIKMFAWSRLQPYQHWSWFSTENENIN